MSAAETQLPEDHPTAEGEERAQGTVRTFGFGWRVFGSLGAGAALALCFPPFNLPLTPLALALLIGLLQGATVRQALVDGV